MIYVLTGSTRVQTLMSPAVVNYVLYQLGWLAAVGGASQGHPWIGMSIALALLAAHLALACHRRSELELVLVAGLTGLIVDSSLVGLGMLSFPSGGVVGWLCPPWIVVMWMQFATTFRYSMRWLVGRPMRAVCFGAIGGPLAYEIGARLGAVILGPHAAALVALGLAWSVAVPGLAWFAEREASTGYRLGGTT